jgi:tetratricopeptide (TPR) repeat protein
MLECAKVEKAIFLAALERGTLEEREAYLQGACGEDRGLFNRLKLLLSVHAEPQGPLDIPFPGNAIARTIDDLVTERPGAIIGRYKLLEQIGEGGFGIVFMAEQQQPVHRKVALKVLKPGMDTRQVIARFEAERQALALMDHPNIAKVLDGGETISGRPYFVMDLVKGIPITEYCNQAHFTPRQRLELFVSVCQAVNHAHQKGIIHRDLKPSNILVTQEDGAPLVKIIDFGIAKALGQQLTDKTLFTGFVQLVGTPLYMSPEQAALSNLDVDTRSDIYALGVLLYELLTGTTPFDRDRLTKASYDEMLRIIREEEPPKPSTRVSTLVEMATAVSTQGQSDSKRLQQLLRGELDWIVMKALEKDRNRRYETVNGLARDIERYLNDEPVLACPPSAGYRFRKFAWRHKAGLLTLGGISAMLAVAVVGLLVANYRITEQRNRAEREHEQSEANFQKARLAVNDYFTLVSESELLDVPGLDTLRRQLLETALHYYEDFIREHHDRSPIQADVAAAHLRVAEITYVNGGSTDQYFPHLRDGVDIIERLIDEHRDTPEVQRQLAGLYVTGKELDISARGAVDLLDVAHYLEKLAHILEKFVADSPEVPELQNDLAGTCRFIAQSYALRSEALPWFEKAISVWEKLACEHPAVAGYRQNLARAYELRGLHLNLKGQRDSVYQSMQKAFVLRRDLVREYPGRASYTAWLAVSYRELGELESALKRPQDAEKNIRRALEGQQQLVAVFPTLHTYRHDLAQTQLALARALRNSGRAAEAIAAYRQALAGLQELVGRCSKITVYRDEYLATVVEESSFLVIRGKHQDASNMLGEAAQFCSRKMQAPFLGLEERAAFAETSVGLAAGLQKLGHTQESEKLYAQTAAIAEKLLQEFEAEMSQRPTAVRGFIGLLRADGEASAALGKWDRALADYARLVAVDPSDHWHWYKTATVYLYLGDIVNYRRVAGRMLERFGDTQIPAVAERAAKTCTLVPQTVGDPERVMKLARLAVAAKGYQNDRWHMMTKALVDYRAGDFTGAVGWLERFSPKADGVDCDASAFAILAMTQHCLDRSPQAQAALAGAKAILAKKMPNPQQGRLFGDNWRDWLHAQVLCREAESSLRHQ